MPEFQPVVKHESKQFIMATGLNIKTELDTQKYLLKIDARNRSNFFTRIWSIIRFIFTGILEI